MTQLLGFSYISFPNVHAHTLGIGGWLNFKPNRNEQNPSN